LSVSVDRPSIVKRRSIAEHVGGRVVGNGIWMVWRERRPADEVAGAGPGADDVIALARTTFASLVGAPLQILGEDATAAAAGGLESKSRETIERLVQSYGVPRGALKDEG